MNRLVGPALRGLPVAWFSPTYKMLSEVYREVRHTLHPITAGANAQEHRIDLVTGGRVDMWSLDSPDSVRGRKYARAVIDEAAMVAALESAWFNVIRPTLTDYRGDADLYSTPRGRNFFWKAFTWGEDAAEPEWGCWRMPTTANPHIDPAEVEAARRQLPERAFRQEYLAEFLEDAGGVFRGVAACVDAGRRENEAPDLDGVYTMGVDLARVEDFTVLDVFDHLGRQVYHERFNQISWERQIAAIVRTALEYRATVYVDSTGVGDPIFEAVRRAGIHAQPYPFTAASKEALIDNLAMKIEQGLVRLMDVPEQTNELLAYQYEVTLSRNVRMNAPEGMHDDCVIGLALAAWGLRDGFGPASWGDDPRGDDYWQG